MLTRVRCFAIAVSAALLFVGSGAASGSSAADRTGAPGLLFLKLRTTPAPVALKASPQLQAMLGAATAHPVLRRELAPAPAGLDRLLLVHVPEDTDVPHLARKLALLPEVEYAEPVWVYDLAATPNDPAYIGGQQTYLANLQVEAAWDVQKSETGSTRPVVCVVDGGTNWQHEDLLANIWSNPGEIDANNIDDDGNGYVDDVHGWNFRDDNGNPRGSPSTPGNANHGSHTGGLLAMVTNNGVGGASASWNPWLMPVNASGGDNSIAHGYEGIVYAAENGASVISLSWGGSGGSPAEQDVIDYATAQGALVVAAAGNGNSSKRFYPAAYRNVLAVANVQNSDVRYNGPSGSNYGGWLDVAAPGTSLYSTFDNNTTNSYGLSTGTSMAAPVAAAVAALVKAAHPTWGPTQVGEQVRVSCDNINGVNPSFVDQLGKGRVNALRAVTLVSPAVRVTNVTFADDDGDGQLEQGENVVMSLAVHNYLAPAVAPSYALSSTSPWVSITDATQAGSTLMEDADATLASAFAFTVDPNAPPGTTLDLRLDITAMGYTDFQYLPTVLEPVFETHEINQLHVSLTATGGVGWVGFPSGFGDEGIGWSYAGSPNLLFEGALLLGAGPTRLSDAARVGSEHTDFTPVLHPAPAKLSPGPSGDEEIHAAFTDSTNATTPLGVRVDLSSWASAHAGDESFVIVAFEVRNRTVAPFDSLYAGLFFDWDIDEAHFLSNRTAYDAPRRLGYAWDETPTLPYTGVMALTGTDAGFSAIDNNYQLPWSIGNGFSKSEKWDVLQGGTGVVAAGPSDISNALASGPYRLPAGGRALVVFALVGGADLASLQAHADRARAFFLDSLLTDTPAPSTTPRAVVWLGDAVPNPFNPQTRFKLEVSEPRDVAVRVFDARGRLVRVLTTGRREPGRSEVAWDGRDAAGGRAASGVYYVQLRSGDLLQTRRVVLAK